MTDQILKSYSNVNQDGDIEPNKMFPNFPKIITDTFSTNKQIGFHRQFYDSGQYKDYFYQMFLGLFFAIGGDPSATMNTIKDAYFWAIDDNLRLFAVHKTEVESEAMVHMHSIFMGKMAIKPSVAGAYPSNVAREAHYVSNFHQRARSITKEEYQSLKERLQTDHGVDLDKADLRLYEYETVPSPKRNDKMTIEMNLMPNYIDETSRDPQKRTEFVDQLTTEPISTPANLYKLPKARDASGRIDFFRNFKNIPILIIEFIVTFIDKSFELYKAEGSPHSGKRIAPLLDSQSAMGGFLHGLLLGSNHIQHLKGPVMKYTPNGENNGILTMQIRDIDTPNPDRYLMVDFSTNDVRQTVGYDFLREIYRSQYSVVHYIRPMYDKTADEIKLNKRLLKWNVPNMLDNLLDQMKVLKEEEAPVDMVELTNSYFRHINGILKPYIDNAQTGLSLDQLKFYLLGIFKAHQESPVTIEAGQEIGSEAATTASLDSFLLHFDSSKENGVMLNLKAVDGSQNVDSRLTEELEVSEATRKLVVDVTMINNGRGLDFRTRYAKNSEISEQYQFRTLGCVELVRLYDFYFQNVDGMLNYGDVDVGTQISNQFKSTFDQLLQETKEFGMGQQAMSSFIDGAFSHFDDKKVYDSFSRDSFSKLVLLPSDYAGVSNILQIDIKLTDDQSVNPVELATVQSHAFNNDDMVPSNTFTIGYNSAKLDNNLAIAAADKRLINFNTENVNEFCSTISGRRRKRFAGKSCSFMEKEVGEIVDPEKSKKIDFEEISTSLKTHPELIGFEKHIQGVFELSGKVQLAFIGRDMIGDTLRGDLKGLGRDSLFFGGSMLANKAGEKMAQAGIDMADAGLKIAGHALTSVGKCLPKLGFDIYMGYQLAQQIKHNDTTGAALTGTFIGIDLLECGLEALAAFGVITLVPVVGQVLLVASTLLLLAVNIYDSIKKVHQIDELVPLSFRETDRELFRAFFHLDSEPLISHLMNEVQANEAIMNRILDANSDIKRFIVASGILTEQVDDQPRNITFLSDNKINMQSKRKIAKISRVLPRKKTLKNTTLFCQMDENDENAEIEESFLDKAEDFLADTWSGTPAGIMSHSFYRLTTGTSENKWKDAANLIPAVAIYDSIIANLFVPNETPKETPIKDYVCINAFGVERIGGSATNDTLFILHDGDDTAVGLKNSPNTFILGDGYKKIIGGDQNDKFVVYGNFTEGMLNGAGGYNALDMSSFSADSPLIILNNFIYYDDYYLTTSDNPKDEAWIQLKNIQEIIGRNGTADSISICNQRAVNLQGGQSWRSSDMIFIKNCGSPINVTIALNNFTNVHNTADDANVTYIVDPLKTDAFVMLNGTSMKKQNKFVFLSIKLLDIKIKYYPKVNGLIFNYNNRKLLSVVQKKENATFLFADGATVKLKNGQLVATLSNERSLMDLIDQYDDYAEENANMTIIAHTHTEDETVILGSQHITIRDGDQEKQINVIRNSFHHALNLVGRRKMENYFLITVTKENIESLEDFKLPEIKIHSHATRKFPDYIDLHMMAVQLHTLGDYDLSVEFANDTNGKDVVLILSARERSNGDLVASIGRIKIIKGQKKFKHLTVFIYNENRIKNNGTDLVLKPTTVHVNEKIITVTPGQIDVHTLLRMNYTVDYAQFYHMGKSLIISNVAHINKVPTDKLFTILFIDYFENQFKFNTIELQFKNHRIQMKDMKGSAWLSTGVRSMWAHIASKLNEIQEAKPKHD